MDMPFYSLDKRGFEVGSVLEVLGYAEKAYLSKAARFRYRTWIHLVESLIQGALAIFMFIVLFILTSGSIKCNIVPTKTRC